MNFKKSKNTQMLKDIQQKSIEKSNGLVAINIPLDEIDENPDNSEIFNMDKIKELADGIKIDGFIGAISVYKKPDGRYEISSGHRRYRAMRMLEKEHYFEKGVTPSIPCIVSEMPDDTERGLKLLSSNIRNRDLGPMDWARAVDYYKHLRRKQKKDGSGEGYKGSLRTDVARYFNLSEGQVSRYEALVKLIPELQEMANNPVYPWNALARASILDIEEQQELYETLQERIEFTKERDRKIPIISLDDDLPFAKEEDQKEADIAQSAISGQYILQEIKKIQNIKAAKFAKPQREASVDFMDIASSNLQNSIEEENDFDEMQSEFVPGTVSESVEMLIEDDPYSKPGKEYDSLEDEIDGFESEYEETGEDQSIDYSFEQSTERIISFARKNVIIKDKRKLRENIKKIEKALATLKNLL